MALLALAQAQALAAYTAALIQAPKAPTAPPIARIAAPIQALLTTLSAVHITALLTAPTIALAALTQKN